MEESQDSIEELKKKNLILQNLVDALKKDKCNELTHIRKNVFETGERPPTAVILTIDNFYNNPMETRKHILTQEFKIRGNYPGQRTKSYATIEMKEQFQKWLYPFGGKITEWPMEEDSYNGSFQYTTSRDRSWFHVDSWNSWAAVLYLTPNAPLNSGTGLYRYKDGTRFDTEHPLRDNKKDMDTASQDVTKWELVDKVGNIFNRLIIFNAHHFHSSMDYFGTTKEDGRLFQVFFFSTEKQQC